MKILLVVDGIFPFVIGGMQKHSYYLCKILSELGHNITVVMPKSQNEKEKIPNIEYHEVEKVRYRFPFHYILEEFLFSRSLYCYVAKSEFQIDTYDAIITKGFVTVSWPKERKGWPMIFTHLHGLEMYQPALSLKSIIMQKPLRFLAKKTLKNADEVLNYGGVIQEIHEKILGVNSNLNLLLGGIPKEFLKLDISKTKEPIRLLFIGRYERRKGIPELREMLNDLVKREVDFNVVWVGDLPDEMKLQSIKIDYKGQVSSQSEYVEIIDDCDILLLPSMAEGLPTVIVEAMGRGLSVIAMNVGAVSMVVNNENGWLVNDYEQFKKTLKEVISLSPLSIDIKKKNALQCIANSYTWPKLAGGLIKTIKSKE